jgi:hypothetical protein
MYTQLAIQRGKSNSDKVLEWDRLHNTYITIIRVKYEILRTQIMELAGVVHRVSMGHLVPLTD